MDNFTLLAQAAKVGPGNGVAVEIGNRRKLTAVVRIAAGSGTVTEFQVWIEGNLDGTNWVEIPCTRVIKSGIVAPGAASINQRDIVDETTLITADIYFGLLESHFSTIRTSWNIVGTTPSETFEVRVRG